MSTQPLPAPTIEGVARARYIRVSPQKARLVVDLIRGQRAEEAIQTLQFTKKRVAKLCHSLWGGPVNLIPARRAASETICCKSRDCRKDKNPAAIAAGFRII